MNPNLEEVFVRVLQDLFSLMFMDCIRYFIEISNISVGILPL